MGYSVRATYSKAELRGHVSIKAEDMHITLALHSFCFGLPEVTAAVWWLQAFGQSGAATKSKLLQSRKARAENWQAETRSTAALPSKESRRGAASAGLLKLQKQVQVCRKLEASKEVLCFLEKVKRKRLYSKKRAGRLGTCPPA